MRSSGRPHLASHLQDLQERGGAPIGHCVAGEAFLQPVADEAAARLRAALGSVQDSTHD